MESIQKTMTFERAKCVGRLLYAIGYMLNVAICCPTESKWNETKCSRQIAFENAQQKLVYWLRPLGVASLHIGIDSYRLDLTWLFSRLVGQCYVNLVHFSFSYIYFFCFFYSCFTAHIIHSTYYTKTQITQQIFTDAVNRNRFNFPSNHRGHATPVSFGRHMPVSFGRRLCGFVLLVWLHCIPKMRVVRTGPDNRYKSAKQPHPTNQESSRHGKMSPDQIKII